MNYELPDKCPICQGKQHVTRLGCDNCGSVLEGRFILDRLSQLSSDMRQFIIIFLKYRGNIREMEKYYNISYPTVRARIDEIITALGEQAAADNAADEKTDSGDTSADLKNNLATVGAAKSQRLDILTKLSGGEIDIDEARELLDKTGK